MRVRGGESGAGRTCGRGGGGVEEDIEGFGGGERAGCEDSGEGGEAVGDAGGSSGVGAGGSGFEAVFVVASGLWDEREGEGEGDT